MSNLNATLGQIAAVPLQELKAQQKLALIAGGLMLALGSLGTTTIIKAQEPIVINQQALNSCLFPQKNGEFLAVTIEQGKLKCWRYY